MSEFGVALVAIVGTLAGGVLSHVFERRRTTDSERRMIAHEGRALQRSTLFEIQEDIWKVVQAVAKSQVTREANMRVVQELQDFGVAFPEAVEANLQHLEAELARSFSESPNLTTQEKQKIDEFFSDTIPELERRQLCDEDADKEIEQALEKLTEQILQDRSASAASSESPAPPELPEVPGDDFQDLGKDFYDELSVRSDRIFMLGERLLDESLRAITKEIGRLGHDMALNPNSPDSPEFNQQVRRFSELFEEFNVKMRSYLDGEIAAKAHSPGKGF